MGFIQAAALLLRPELFITSVPRGPRQPSDRGSSGFLAVNNQSIHSDTLFPFDLFDISFFGFFCSL
jgi:hypothetical protein